MEFSVAPDEKLEQDGFVEVDVDGSEIIARNEMEIFEQKFREMGLSTADEQEDNDEIRFGSFEDLNEISHQEQQQSLPFRNDI